MSRSPTVAPKAPPRDLRTTSPRRRCPRTPARGRAPSRAARRASQRGRAGHRRETGRPSSRPIHPIWQPAQQQWVRRVSRATRRLRSTERPRPMGLPCIGSAPSYGSASSYGSGTGLRVSPAYGSAPGLRVSTVLRVDRSGAPATSPPNYAPPNYAAGTAAYAPESGYGRPTGYIPPDWQSSQPPGSGPVSPPGPAAPSAPQRSIAGRILVLAAVVALFRRADRNGRRAGRRQEDLAGRERTHSDAGQRAVGVLESHRPWEPWRRHCCRR